MTSTCGNPSSASYKPKPFRIQAVRGQRQRHQEFLLTAGTLLDRATPEELLSNPVLKRQDTPVRKEQEEFYAKRAAYIPPIHTRLPGGDQRRKCPTCAGKLRPFDVMEAANRNLLNKPALQRIDGVDRCCEQQVVRISGRDLGKHHQDVPFGTPAWSKSYGRREQVEAMNSLLRTNLLRIDRGICKTLDPSKYHLLYGLALAAVNLLSYERHLSKTQDAAPSREADEIVVNVGGISISLEGDAGSAAWVAPTSARATSPPDG